MTDILEGRAHPAALPRTPALPHPTSTAVDTWLNCVMVYHGDYRAGMETFFSNSEWFWKIILAGNGEPQIGHQARYRSDCGLALQIKAPHSWPSSSFPNGLDLSCDCSHPSIKSWWTQFTVIKTRLPCITKAIDLLYNIVSLIKDCLLHVPVAEFMDFCPTILSQLIDLSFNSVL